MKNRSPMPKSWFARRQQSNSRCSKARCPRCSCQRRAQPGEARRTRGTRKDPSSLAGTFRRKVYRTAFEAGLSDLTLTEFYYKRLTDDLPNQINGQSYPGKNWWFVLVPVLVLAAFFVFWMYVKDMRSIPWYVAILLALLLRSTACSLICSAGP
jgi:hypothetical protein